MKKTILAICCILASTAIFARPQFRPAPPPPRHGPFRPMPPPPPPRHHHHPHHVPGFWPGLVGGMIVGTALSQPRPAVVVSQPPVVVQPATQQVWVEGRYVDVIAPNGTVVRQWQPGHWETVTVPVR